ncbi:c-type cytochrome [Temperatibacter marinus]|uniref:C-type cytochrome n=1 Tax=Temperatibacter marinus TaxID=1456591 RepID=A0AA52EEG6_9PROT|nr:c-type cytochrome [Temperatibacter marinus]WND03301.1 c-type cytochrome [Temperatibacter marinus]
MPYKRNFQKSGAGVAIVSFLLIVSAGMLKSVSADDRDGYSKQSPPRTLTQAQEKRAAQNYQKYCSLCHGENREGYANDNAPSLTSRSLIESGVPHGILRTLSYGRDGTAMGGYLDEVGGPLSLDETWDLTYWLFWQSGHDRIRLTENPVQGDREKGKGLFQQHCATCHGEDGKGVEQDGHMIAPVLSNPSFLAYNKDEFIRYAIEWGREGTAMQSFRPLVSEEDLDNLTAYVRSFETGVQPLGKPILRAEPEPKDYIINPNQSDPDFELRDGKYISSETLYAALKEGRRMVLLDTRVPSVWQRSHIEGSVPVPYYTDVDKLMEDIPKGVQIVAYCSCPRAAADYLVKQLNDMGYSRTAVLYEGIFGWMQKGLPVMRGAVVR